MKVFIFACVVVICVLIYLALRNNYEPFEASPREDNPAYAAMVRAMTYILPSNVGKVPHVGGARLGAMCGYDIDRCNNGLHCINRKTMLPTEDYGICMKCANTPSLSTYPPTSCVML